MGVSKLLATLVICYSSGLLAQDRHMVFFKDKAGSPYTLSQPSEFLSAKSINRRTRQGIALTPQDLPVNQAYMDAVAATGSKVLYRTKWLNGVLIEATSAQKTSVSGLPFVASVKLVAPGKTGSGGRLESSTKLTIAESSQVTQTQNSMLALDEMHRDGFAGAGITIAVLDAGFPSVNTNPAFSPLIQSGRIIDAYNFAYRQPNVFANDKHGTQVLSILAGSLPGFTGGAFEANFLLYTTEYVPTEYRVEEYHWLFAAERADSAGADILSSSLGYTEFKDASMDYSFAALDGKTTVVSQAALLASQRGMVVVNSAGNEGDKTWKYVSPPADVAQVIAVGAVDESYQYSPFSSIGPTADGRIKPDVMALGAGAATILPDGTVRYVNGTSLACPLITSLVAGVWQSLPELTADELVGLIRLAGSRAFNPDNNLGYGIPTYRAIKNMRDFPSGSPILIYPNPVIENEVKVAVAPTDGSVVNVGLYSLMGQTLLHVTYESIWNLNPYRIDLTNQAPGVYWLKVENKQVVKTFKLIKP